MGRTSSIDPETGKALISAYQRVGSVAGAARAVGVSESAARRYFDALPAETAPAVATAAEIVEAVAAGLQEPFAVLQINFERLTRLCDVAQSASSPREIQAYTGVIKEIREHVEASAKLAALILSADETRKFQQAVIEAIGEADDATRRRILTKLRERRSVGVALLRP
jgi:molybdenum-dependent DNA-binding transcriptional regulator ModE